MKIIFLDIDGVLLTRKSLLEGGPFKLDPDCVNVLNDIIAATDAYIVVSSTWRILHKLPKLKEVLSKQGVPFNRIISVTPIHRSSGNVYRGNEIQEWLDEYSKFPSSRLGKVEQFCIIDDDSDMVHLTEKLVKTNMVGGLQQEHSEKVIAMLNGK